MRHAKRFQTVFLPGVVLLILIIDASGCDTTALVTRLNDARASLKDHGIEVRHGKILRVFRC